VWWEPAAAGIAERGQRENESLLHTSTPTKMTHVKGGRADVKIAAHDALFGPRRPLCRPLQLASNTDPTCVQTLAYEDASVRPHSGAATGVLDSWGATCTQLRCAVKPSSTFAGPATVC
jgi:hypothetical protein